VKTRRFLLAAALAATAGSTLAQAFPSRSLTLLVPFPPGGSTDMVARVIAEKLQASLGRTVVVENRPGGGAQIAASALMKANADGHTLMIGDTGALAVNTTLYPKLSFDPLKDFAPVTALVSTPLVLVVSPENKAAKASDVVAHARQNPKGVSYASQGIGTIGHLLGEQLRERSGAPFHHVAYRGSAPALQDVIGGQVEMLFDPVSTAWPMITAGKVKALGVASARRSPALPQVPTLAEAGVPGVEGNVWWGLVVKAGTPPAAVNRLNAEVHKALASPDVAKRFAELGLESTPMSPERFGEFMKAEVARWAPIVKASGATVD
jgi:tripartite-type tricarboxylate transporter receptor subunit TctC